MLSVLSDFINKRKTTDIDVSEDIIKYSKIHGLSGIVFYQTKDSRFASAYSKVLSSYANRQRLIKDIKQIFEIEKIDYFFVKGPVVAEFYPVPALRSMGDVDIIVHSEDREKVREILLSKGFVNESSRDDCEWDYYKGDLKIEIHDNLLYFDAINPKCEMDLMTKAWDYVNNNELDINFHFVYLLIHLKKHLLYEGVGFRQFMDIAVLIKYGGLDFDKVKELLKKAKMFEFASVCMSLCEKWFNINSPVVEKISDVFYNDVTSRILCGGVFGFQNNNSKETRQINSVVKRGKLCYIITVLFPPYKELRYNKKYFFVLGRPWLLPVAWIYRFVISITNKSILNNGKALLSQTSNKDLPEQTKYLNSWGIHY